MPKAWEDITKRLLKWWQEQSLNQKVLFILLTAICAGLCLSLLLWVSRPDYTLLYSNLDPKDANDVVEYLREQKIPYRLQNGGTQIEVPAAKVYDLRVQLAGKGLPRGTNVGFEIFDKMSFGVTEEIQRINYLRALQSELERTIEALDVIDKARVHLVLPEEDLWLEESFTPSASVMVKLRNGGNLLPRQVESIRHLLASAVRSMLPERVTIVDTQGRVLSTAGEADGAAALSDRQLNYKKKLEENLKQQTESMLAEILGPGKVSVRVNADIDFNQILTERESYAPVVGRQGLIRSEKQNMFESAQDQAAAGGAAGTPSNLQGYPPAAANGTDKSTRKNEKVVNYEMNRTVERINTAMGAIRQLSVGIFVDGNYKPEQLADINTVVSRGLGINPERGDKVEIRAFPFNRGNLKEEKELMEKAQRQRFWLTLLTRWLPLGLLGLGAGWFLWTGWKNLQRLALESRTAGEPGEEGSDETLNVEKLAALLRQNSTNSAQVLKHWLS